MDLEKLVVSLTADTSTFKAGLDDIGNNLGKLGAGILGAGAVAIGAFATTLAAGVKGAMDYQNEIAELDAVLKSTGNVAGVNRQALLDQADAIQKTTKFTQEETLAAQSMLLTFTKIGGDVFPDATKATMDLAEKFGSVEQASIMLGKALNDPIQGVSALRRVGVQLSAAQEESIKSMVEMGDVAGAQAIILGEIETQVGGLAEAAGNTLEGKIIRLKNSFGELQEGLVGGLLDSLGGLADSLLNFLDNEEVLDFFKNIGESIGDFAKKVIEWIPQAIEWFRTAFAWLEQNKPVVVGILAALGVAIGAFVWTLVAMVAAFAPVILVMALVGAAAALLYMAWTNNWGGIQEKTAAVVDWLTTNIQALITNISAWWDANGEAIITSVQSIWQGVVDTFNWFKLLFTEIFATFRLAQEGDWYGFGEKLREVWDAVWEKIKEIASAAWTWIKTEFIALKDNIIAVFTETDWQSVGTNIILGIKKGIENAANALARSVKAAVDAAYRATKGFLGIKSPSVLFAEIGKNTMLGFAQGIDQFAKIPVSMTMNASKDIASGISTASVTTPAPSGGRDIENFAREMKPEPINYQLLARAIRDAMMQVA